MTLTKKERFEEYLKNCSQLDIHFKEEFTSERLLFVKVDTENYNIIYEMFKNDQSPFVDGRFKNLNELEIYFHETLRYLYHTSRGCDWLLFKKKTKEVVGIFHLYDFSRETVNNRHKRCTIGFSINEKFRRQYFATEAIMKLSEYIFNELKMKTIIADIAKNNYPAKKILQNLNFTNKTEDYYYATKYDFYELTTSMFDDFKNTN